jgi:aspartate kinase
MKQKDRTKIGGILIKRGLSRICLPSISEGRGTIGLIFEVLGQREINCPFIVQSTGADGGRSLTICVAEPRLAEAVEALRAIGEALGTQEAVCAEAVAMISIFGPHFGERAGISGVMFSALEAAGIEIQAISTSISSLSSIVAAGDVDRAVEALQRAFEMP